jgi:hypothetical protein
MNVFWVGASLWERVASFFLLPLLRPVIYKAMGCGKENAKKISFRKITDIFSKVKALRYNLIPQIDTRQSFSVNGSRILILRLYGFLLISGIMWSHKSVEERVFRY